MANTDLIGVVTVTYNSATVLQDFLRCMSAQTHGKFLLYVVDNASSDDTVRILHECTDPRLKVIANSDNRGVAAGNNQGIQAAFEAGCGSILLINNDTEFGPELLSQLYEALEVHQVEMTCPKMMYYDEPDRIWAAGGKFQPWLGYRIIHIGENELDRGQYDEAQLVTYVPTCCVLIRKEVFDAIGFMDERYFVYMDDVDFMFRAMKTGLKLEYIPSAKLLHKVGRLTGGEDSPFAIRFCTRNRAYFMLQHFGFVTSLPFLALYQLYFAGGLICRKFSFKIFCIKQKAVWDALTMWSGTRSAEIHSCRQ